MGGNGFSSLRVFPLSFWPLLVTLCFPIFLKTQNVSGIVEEISKTGSSTLITLVYVFIVLNERERELVVRRLRLDAGPATEQHFSWVQFRAAFTDYKVYLHSLVYICGSIPLYSLSLFLPSIISGMGFTNLTAQAMSAPPYAIGKLEP
jgi:hypothetical protein